MSQAAPPPYSDEFYRTLDETAEASAERIWPILREILPVESVVDVGCSEGGWLAAARRCGIFDVLGLDGPWVDELSLKIPVAQFRRVRLDAPFAVGRRFDLALSLEVAEHLPAERAADFIAELTALAPVVLFSAAIPGQGGVHHVNEQWPSYWAGLFAERGYRAVDVLRPRVWNDKLIAYWYRQNLVLFASAEALAARPDLAAAAGEPLPLVHPDLFRAVGRVAQPRIGRWLKMAPQVIRRTLAPKAKAG
ncbi:MAG TPA: class I SAM-dependent methyltransferase [Stellaceae bacterium]|nr:class I SAM-dependent methyltransferase [Stellaceae bacterium]